MLLQFSKKHKCFSSAPHWPIMLLPGVRGKRARQAANVTLQDACRMDSELKTILPWIDPVQRLPGEIYLYDPAVTGLSC